MAKPITDYRDEELQRFINSYRRESKTEGGVYSLAELLVEQLSRSPAPKSPKDIFRYIVESSAASPAGNVTYGEVWDFLYPRRPWQGNHSGRLVGTALGAVIAYCVRNDLPIVSTLVVRSGSRRLSPDAIKNIYEESKSYGIDVGLHPEEFVQQETAKSRALDLQVLPD